MKEATNKKEMHKQASDLNKAKRSYDKSLASCLRFLVEYSTGKLDSDEILEGGIDLAKKLVNFYDAPKLNNAKGRKQILDKIKENCTYITDNGVVAKKCCLRKDVREAAGYVASKCAYIYRQCTWMESLVDGFSHQKAPEKIVAVFEAPTTDAPSAGTIEIGKNSEELDELSREQLDVVYIQVLAQLKG